MSDKFFQWGLVFLMIAVVACIAAIPSIWALNTLFALAIPYNAKTIIATMILIGAVRSGTK